MNATSRKSASIETESTIPITAIITTGVSAKTELTGTG
jgi:hypothetical protein